MDGVSFRFHSVATLAYDVDTVPSPKAEKSSLIAQLEDLEAKLQARSSDRRIPPKATSLREKRVDAPGTLRTDESPGRSKRLASKKESKVGEAPGRKRAAEEAQGRATCDTYRTEPLRRIIPVWRYILLIPPNRN